MKLFILYAGWLILGAAASARGGPRDQCKALINHLADHYSASCTLSGVTNVFEDVILIRADEASGYGVNLGFDAQTNTGVINLIRLKLQPDPLDHMMTNSQVTCNSNSIAISYDQGAQHTEQRLRLLTDRDLSISHDSSGGGSHTQISCRLQADSPSYNIRN